MACSNAATESTERRRRHFCVTSPNSRSTALSHEPLVGDYPSFMVAFFAREKRANRPAPDRAYVSWSWRERGDERGIAGAAAMELPTVPQSARRAMLPVVWD